MPPQARYGRTRRKWTRSAVPHGGHRTGLWVMHTELLETQTVDFSVGAEGLRHTPGDIEVATTITPGRRSVGVSLTADISTRTLTLDRGK